MMDMASLGEFYEPGEKIVTQGDTGDCMFVVQEGEAEVVREDHDGETRLAVLRPGDFFGEMALFERQTRAATVRAIGRTRVLTVDKRTFMGRVQEDPSLAFNLVRTLSHRIRCLNDALVEAGRAARPGTKEAGHASG